MIGEEDDVMFEDDGPDGGDMFFEEEDSPADSLAQSKKHKTKEKWKVIMIDDEPTVHQVSRMALANFTFGGKEIDFISAYSAKEAKEIIPQHPDVALIFLDVVMEEDDSGLKVARFIREEAKNLFVRIILRTGQPGQAPEQEVLIDYDINDYKEKTELTKKKLFSTVISSLRSYRDIITIEKNRQGLEQILHSSTSIFSMQSMENFISGVMIQLVSILQLSEDAFYSEGPAKEPQAHVILAGTGIYDNAVGKKLADIAEQEVLDRITRVCVDRISFLADEQGFTYLQNSSRKDCIFLIYNAEPLDEVDKKLIELFVSQVALAYHNLSMKIQVEDTQLQLTAMLAAAAETRSRRLGNHVLRVGKYASLLSSKYKLDREDTELLRLASPLYDLGKIRVPPEILEGNGNLAEEDKKALQKYPQHGREILQESLIPRLASTPVIEAAAIAAFQHREQWDGKGYPQGLAGENIHIYGRIVAMAVAFDDLGDKSEAEIIESLNAQRGKALQPELVDTVLDSLAEFQALRQSYPG